jgi:nucleoside diphosphate kinase
VWQRSNFIKEKDNKMHKTLIILKKPEQEPHDMRNFNTAYISFQNYMTVQQQEAGNPAESGGVVALTKEGWKEFYKHVSHIPHFDEMCESLSDRVHPYILITTEQPIETGKMMKKMFRELFANAYKDLKEWENIVHISDNTEEAEKQLQIINNKEFDNSIK